MFPKRHECLRFAHSDRPVCLALIEGVGRFQSPRQFSGTSCYAYVPLERPRIKGAGALVLCILLPALASLRAEDGFLSPVAPVFNTVAPETAGRPTKRTLCGT